MPPGLLQSGRGRGISLSDRVVERLAALCPDIGKAIDEAVRAQLDRRRAVDRGWSTKDPESVAHLYERGVEIVPVAGALLDGNDRIELGEPPDQRRGKRIHRVSGDVVEQDRQARARRDVSIVREDLVVGQLHEIRRQDQGPVTAGFLRVVGQGDGLLDGHRPGADDQGSAPAHPGSGDLVEPLSLVVAQGPEFAGATPDHQARRALGQQPVHVARERLLVDPTLGVERGRHGRKRALPIDTVSIHLT